MATKAVKAKKACTDFHQGCQDFVTKHKSVSHVLTEKESKEYMKELNAIQSNLTNSLAAVNKAMIKQIKQEEESELKLAALAEEAEGKKVAHYEKAIGAVGKLHSKLVSKSSKKMKV